MRIGYVQTSPIFGRKIENFIQIDELLQNRRADLIVLPELFATGYAFTSKKEVSNLAENENGETFNFLKNLSKKTGAILVGGFIERNNNKLYNSAMIVSESEVIGIYRKLHLYFKEKLWFTPGDTQLEIYNIKNIRIGVIICFDWLFPETMRTLSLLGADIIAHPSNLVLPYCQKAMIIRCLENGVFAITSNRIGEENRGDDSFKFTGSSQIISNKGEILSSAPSNKIFVDIIDIDVKNARNKKLNQYNDLINDRRANFYRL